MEVSCRATFVWFLCVRFHVYLERPNTEVRRLACRTTVCGATSWSGDSHWDQPDASGLIGHTKEAQYLTVCAGTYFIY